MKLKRCTAETVILASMTSHRAYFLVSLLIGLQLVQGLTISAEHFLLWPPDGEISLHEDNLHHIDMIAHYGKIIAHEHHDAEQHHANHEHDDDHLSHCCHVSFGSSAAVLTPIAFTVPKPSTIFSTFLPRIYHNPISAPALRPPIV